MKRNFKLALVLLLIATMLMSTLIPTFANYKEYADMPGGQIGNNVYWAFDEEDTLIVYGSGAMYDLCDIDEYFDDYVDYIEYIKFEGSVTTVGEDVFSYLDSLTTVDFGSSMVTINSWAFAYCNSLETIYLPTTVKTINDAFIC